MITFLPDAAETTPEVLTAVSAVPTLNGYRNPYNTVSLGYSALAANSLGGALCFKLDGSTRVLAGTSTRLYEGSGTSWSDVSRGALYSIGSNRWRFAQFGNTTLAINKATQLQQSSSGAFADVANAPKAACMASASGFLMLANCDDSGTGLTTGYGDQAHRWWCSQIFSPTGTWAPSVSTQATSGLLVETPGAITGLVRLNADMVAYKAKSIYVGRYVGSPVVWQWQVVADDVGAATQDAVVATGQAHYFIGENDIYAFDGTRPVPIGAGIKDWFFSRLNRQYAFNIESIHDAVNKSCYWFYPSGSSTEPTSVLVYRYDVQRWGHFEIAVRDVMQAVTSAITYDSLGTLYATYSDMPDIGYDSPFWVASNPVISVIGTDNILRSLTGTTGASSLTTGWIGDEVNVSTCTRVRPKFRTYPTTATITPSNCMWLGGTQYTGATSNINQDRFDVLQGARYHKFAMSFTGGMEIEAIAPTLVASGQE